MPISTAQLREVLEKPRNVALVREAAQQESRIRLHSQAALSQGQPGGAVTAFLDWVRGLVPRDKYKLFVHLFRYPVKTVEAVEEAFEALEKVFDGRDPAYLYDFVSTQAGEDWQRYQAEKLGWPAFWRQQAFGQMKTAINSLLVVDLPREQAGMMPEPYAYFLDVCEVLDFEMKGMALEWVIFKQPEGRVAVFDDAAFRVYRSNGQVDFGRWELETEAFHSLGYCPAQWFWSEPLSYSRPALKKSPVSAQLDNLDWLLFYSVSKRVLDSYASWPIYWSYIQDCSYSSPGGEEYCDGGHLRNASGQYILSRSGMGTEMHVAECPACSSRRLTGPGSLIGISAPGPANSGADLRPPAGVIAADTGNLEYVAQEASRLRQAFFRAVTGYAGEPVNSQAVNEKQVAAFFEAYTQTLRNLKKNFEAAQKWAAQTICRLRYGPAFASAHIDMGTEFYIYTADEAFQAYQQAKASGASPARLGALMEQYLESRHRNNLAALSRARLLLALEPLAHLSVKEAQEMYRAGEASYEEYRLKADFPAFIARFERENTNILQWGSLLAPGAKIEKLKQILTGYAREHRPAEDNVSAANGEGASHSAAAGEGGS